MSTAKFNLDNYVPVSERIEHFWADYPTGRILTSIVDHSEETGSVLMRAEVYRQPEDTLPAATGHAFEVKGEGYINKTSHIENCETSAAGRALALLGYEIKRGIASREEMQKVERMNGDKPKTSEEAESGELLKLAEKMLAKLPEDKRKQKLENLKALPLDEMRLKVNELSENLKAKTKVTEKVAPDSIQKELDKKRAEIKAEITKGGPKTEEKFTAYMAQHYQDKGLDELSLDAVNQIHDDWILPF